MFDFDIIFKRYVVAKDTDEITMPMASHQVSFENKLFLKYLNQIINTSNRTRESSLNLFEGNVSLLNSSNLAAKSELMLKKSSKTSILLSYSNFIKNQNFDRFCQKFWIEKRKDELLFAAKNISANQSRLALFDEDIFDSNENRLRISIYFEDQEQTNYATYLCMLNDHLVQPWLNSNSIANRTIFSRFFSTFYYHNGKSIHDTRNVLTIATHATFVNYNYDGNKCNIYHSWPNFCYECGFTAHFRETPYLYLLSGVYLNIKSIFFDTTIFKIASSFSGF